MCFAELVDAYSWDGCWRIEPLVENQKKANESDARCEYAELRPEALCNSLSQTEAFRWSVVFLRFRHRHSHLSRYQDRLVKKLTKGKIVLLLYYTASASSA